MTVSVQTPYNSSTGNGVTTVFPYSFKLISADDLKVTVDNVLRTIGVDYTVSGVGGNGGNVTFIVAPANGAIVVRYSDTLMKRDTDYQQNGDFREDVVDADFDRLWLGLRDTTSKADRGLRAPPGETFADLPVAATRVSRLLGFDGSGVPALYAQGSLGTIVPTAYIATLLDDADAPAARLTLGAPAAANGTHTGTTTVATLAVSGGVVVDTSTLVVDATNDRVGVGVAVPTNRLHVRRDANDTTATVLVANIDAGASARASVGLTNFGGTTAAFSLSSPAGGNLVRLEYNGLDRMVIDGNGSVLFGGLTVAPTGYVGNGDVSIPAARAMRAINTLKAWVNFDGTAASPITPRAHHNVVSVTKHAAGDYTCNLTAGIFADANYSAVGTAGSTTAAGFYTFRGPVQQTPTATAYRCRVSDAVPNYMDVNHICVQFAGN